MLLLNRSHLKIRYKILSLLSQQKYMHKYLGRGLRFNKDLRMISHSNINHMRIQNSNRGILNKNRGDSQRDIRNHH